MHGMWVTNVLTWQSIHMVLYKLYKALYGSVWFEMLVTKLVMWHTVYVLLYNFVWHGMVDMVNQVSETSGGHPEQGDASQIADGD
jgi:hypothetical protein